MTHGKDFKSSPQNLHESGTNTLATDAPPDRDGPGREVTQVLGVALLVHGTDGVDTLTRFRLTDFLPARRIAARFFHD